MSTAQTGPKSSWEKHLSRLVGFRGAHPVECAKSFPESGTCPAMFVRGAVNMTNSASSWAKSFFSSLP